MILLKPRLSLLEGSIKIVLVSPIGYPYGGSTSMFLCSALGNYFGTWEGYLVGVSLGTLVGLMIDTRERYLVGL